MNLVYKEMVRRDYAPFLISKAIFHSYLSNGLNFLNEHD